MEDKTERDTHEKEWITSCGSCGAKSEVTWKQAVNDGCPICCSFKISIYHKKKTEKR